MSTKIIRCNCVHTTQDTLYGVGNRMANEMKSGQFRCTVCNTIAGYQGGQTIKMKESIQERVNTSDKKKMGKKEKSEDKKEKRHSLKGGKR